MNNYTIEDLINTFSDHHEEVLKTQQDNLEKILSGLMEANKWTTDTFSLPLALLTICKEIKKLKEE